MMVDEDVAYVSPSSVYQILRDAYPLYRWKRSQRSGDPPPEPTVPNERWRPDLMYLRVEDTRYFLVKALDTYNRYVVHRELLTTMTAAAVRVVIRDTLKQTEASPEIVTDNGSQFTAKGFEELVQDFEFKHIRIRTHHPESNGKLERFHRSRREALDEQELENLGGAREIIGCWVAFYNGARLHAPWNHLPAAQHGSATRCTDEGADGEDGEAAARQERARIDQPSAA